MIVIVQACAVLLWGAVWGSIVLRVADRYFTRRDPPERIPVWESYLWGVLMFCATFGVGSIASAMTDAALPRSSYWPWLAGLTVVSVTHAANAWLAWLVLAKGTSRPRAAIVSAAAAAAWLVSLAAGLVLLPEVYRWLVRLAL